MPRGEWKARKDLEFETALCHTPVKFRAGSALTLLDASGDSVILGINGSYRTLQLGIDEFHRSFEPHWRDSAGETFGDVHGD